MVMFITYKQSRYEEIHNYRGRGDGRYTVEEKLQIISF